MDRPDSRYLPASYAPNMGMVAEDAGHRARRYAEQFEESHRRLVQLVNHLSDLVGDHTRGLFIHPLESVQENAGEAFYNYAEALTDRDDRLTKAVNDERSSTLALVHCAERLQARWRKSNRPLPDDLAEIVVIAASKSGWDYLFPPGDGRHVHDTDSGGNCRNPACSYNSDAAYNESEPF